MAGHQTHAMIAVVVAEKIENLSFDEFCATCQAAPDFVKTLMAYGVLEPKKKFDAKDLKLLRTAMHLYHDLEINHAGIALAIDLMHEMNRLRQKIDLMEKLIQW